VDGDEGQISQLFHNLLTNALKYRKREVAPAVHVSAQRTANEWTILLPRQWHWDCERISGTDIRNLQTAAQKTEYPGTGIGLALCQRIIEGQAGRIWVESKPGVGSTFYFTWPGIEGE
jgi:light-regulated signal transduction histidine kinase (bacteriophytochrome)